MRLNPEVIDLDTAFCPTCGPEQQLAVQGPGERADKAWCDNCGWEGTAGALMDFFASLDED